MKKDELIKMINEIDDNSILDMIMELIEKKDQIKSMLDLLDSFDNTLGSIFTAADDLNGCYDVESLFTAVDKFEEKEDEINRMFNCCDEDSMREIGYMFDAVDKFLDKEDDINRMYLMADDE